MLTRRDLVASIGAALRSAGASYGHAGTRDKHYAVWVFSIAFDEARGSGGAVLQGLRAGPVAVFRGKPGDIGSRVTYTHAQLRGARRDWEAHVDVRMLGTSGAQHGVDVSVVDAKVTADALRDGRPPRLATSGLGIEAKCFAGPLSPNEGRVALGFQIEMNSLFWLVANQTNPAVETMLSAPRRSTRFFGEARPRTPVEGDIRRAVVAHLAR